MISLPRVLIGQNHAITTLSVEPYETRSLGASFGYAGHGNHYENRSNLSESAVCSVERIDDTAGFERLKPEWNDLLHESESDCLFLTWEWLFTWWKHLSGGRRLHILAVRCGAQLVGLAPLAIRPWQPGRLIPFKILEFLGTGSVGSDYLDVIIRRGNETLVKRALSGYLVDSTLMLELGQLRNVITGAQQTAENLANRDWQVQREVTDVCPFINLAELTWDEYVSTLGSSHRRNLRKRIRNLYDKFSVRLETAVSEQERQSKFAQFLELHNRRWSADGGSDALNSSKIVDFHAEFSRMALESGWLRLRIMYLDDQPATAIYGFRYGDTFYYYQAGHNPEFSAYSVGLVSLGLSIQQAIGEGAKEYDLLHGNEGYKALWTHKQRELCRIRLYPPNLPGFLYRRDMQLRESIKFLRDRLLRANSDKHGNAKLTGQGAESV